MSSPFAYYDGLAADAVPTPSTCEEDGKPRNDGSIDIDIRIGTPSMTMYSQPIR